MRAVLLSCLSLLAVACATGETPSDAPHQSSALSAPTPEGVALVIKADSNSQNVTVKKGTKFAVELVGTPTAGLLWTAVETPPFIAPAGEYGGPTSSAQNEPGFAGGNHWEAFLFDVNGVGEGEFRFEQRSAFGGDEGEPPADTFSVYLFAEE